MTAPASMVMSKPIVTLWYMIIVTVVHYLDRPLLAVCYALQNFYKSSSCSNVKFVNLPLSIHSQTAF